MRRRLVVSTIAIVLVVLGALAIPIGFVVYNAAEQQLRAELQRQADKVSREWDAAILANEDPLDSNLLQFLGPENGLRITIGDDLVFRDVPFTNISLIEGESEGMDGATITILTNADPLDDNFRDQLRILVLLALGAILAAAALAAVQARQLARPLERLALRAARVGDGDFSTRPFIRTNIPEIDRIGIAVDASAEKVDTMLANERHFTADATHQLRTGIAGIAMRLEILTMYPDPVVSKEAATGLDQTDQLNATIDELLAATRNRSTTERAVFDLADFVQSHVDEWVPRFAAVRRHISMITSNPAPPVYGTKGLAGQVIDILIDNALRHGAGSVTLMIDGPSVIVIDQGRGVANGRVKSLFDGPVDPAARHGRGLSLARRLAQVDGATLDVVGNRPLRLRFTLVRGDRSNDD